MCKRFSTTGTEITNKNADLSVSISAGTNLYLCSFTILIRAYEIR